MIRYHTIRVIPCQIVMVVALLAIGCKKQDPVILNGSTSQRLNPLTGQYKDYYLPLQALPPEGVVYTYKNLLDPGAVKEVWRHIQRGEDGIESINYDPAMEPVLRQYDRIVSNGIVADSLIMRYRDSTDIFHEVKVAIHSPNRFPFEPGDSSTFWLTHFEWRQPGDSLRIVLQRRRYFAGDTTWTWQGKKLPAIRFRTEDTFETELDGWTSSGWTGEEVYARDIGLVYYKRNISADLNLEFALESIKQ